jgi:transcription elongation factor Elf1
MTREISTSKVFIQYIRTCNCFDGPSDHVHTQSISDMEYIGTLICPECGEEMEILDNVIIEE